MAEKVLCPECVRGKMTSRVFMKPVAKSTLVHFEKFYDKEGELHSHNPNVIEQAFSCSNGHHWRDFIRYRCWCGWDRNKENGGAED